ncbi:MAG: S1 family peptidase [Silvanigrellales bacterium]|nr:S1 family peptidase [Silvanigrellales bacterium]
MKVASQVVFGSFSALALVTFSVACSSPEEIIPTRKGGVFAPVSPTDNPSNVSIPSGLSGIVGGRRLAEGDVGSTSVVALVDARAGGLCTGTLVAENLVVTAGHCLLDGAMTHVVFGDSVNSRDAEVRPIRARGSLLGSVDEYPNNDVAWVKFQGASPKGWERARILDDASVLTPNQPLVLVGYGKTGDGAAPSGRRLTVSTTFGGLVNNDTFRNLLVVGPNRGKGNCFGDSGGPAFAKVDGEWLVVSALSGLEETLTPGLDCASGHTVHNVLGVHKEWISSTSGISLP